MGIERYLEKYRREEGFNNAEDIYDLTTFSEIVEDIRNENTVINEYLESYQLPEKEAITLTKARKFCDEVSEMFRSEFINMIEEYRQQRKRMSEKVIEHLKEKQLILPNFEILNGEMIYEKLDEFGIDYHLYNEKSLMLVFQLPKPLAKFWWKGGVDSWGTGGVDVSGTVIEWGHFYRELMRKTWQMQGYYQNEEGLDFTRINNVGQHDPDKYYYIWEVEQY